MRRALFCLILFLQIRLLSGQSEFSFVFLPDLHLQPDSVLLANFSMLARQINRLSPDFVLTGGDMIYTAKSVNDKKAGVLFDLMDMEFKMFNMPVFLTMGNHENVGITVESGIDNSNPMWGKRMYEKRYPLLNPHAINDSGEKLLSENSETVLNLFKDYKLKIVLEGHTHLFMNLLFEGIRYISGGSTSYASDLNNHNDGFLMVRIKNNQEESEFIQTERKPVHN